MRLLRWLMPILAIVTIALPAQTAVPGFTLVPEPPRAGTPLTLRYAYTTCIVTPQSFSVSGNVVTIRESVGGLCITTPPRAVYEVPLGALSAGTYEVRVIDLAQPGVSQSIGSFVVLPAVEAADAPALSAIGFVVLMFSLAAAAMLGLSRLE